MPTPIPIKKRAPISTPLDAAKIHYTLNRNRPDTVLVSITVVGMRFEVDVFRDGRMDVRVFKGTEAPARDSALLLLRVINENSG